MKSLNGKELADFIKERQAHQVRSLRQSFGIKPKLLILRDSLNPVIDVYVGLKKRYGDDILVDVEDKVVPTEELIDYIKKANQDKSFHGIIVQLPLKDQSCLDDILSSIDPKKDVDGLSGKGELDSATAQAINWLLAGYNVDLERSKIAIIGRGLLVGAPLASMWRNSGYDVTVFSSKDSDNLENLLPEYDVVVSATGVAGLIKPNMIKEGGVVVDAGTASENGVIKGDASEDLRQRDDIKITPQKGGVGPLTVASLFDNVIKSASKRVKSNS